MHGYVALFLLQMVVSRVSQAHSLRGTGLRWVRVSVPLYKMPGDDAELQCHYELGNDSLYAVKWYKDQEEFYRYVPRRRPVVMSFPIEGVHVDMNISDSKRVVLRNVSWNTSGLFRCEVSAEAPSFASAQGESRMEVVYPPKKDPTITGVEPEYQIGNEIDLNCTSGESYPQSSLSWYINDKQVSSQDQLIKYQPMVHGHGLISAILGLRFVLTGRHFADGAMRVKCVASVWPALWHADHENALQSLPSRELREALLLVRGTATAPICSTLMLFSVLMIPLTV